MRFLRFDDKILRNKNTSRGRLDPIRNVWTKFIQNSQKHFTPDQNVTIDEMMIPFRGRCSFKMYLPAKPCKYGLKIFALVDLDSKYFYNGEIYQGNNKFSI